MANNLKKSILGVSSPVTFQEMIQHFGVVTVMNARIYDTATILSNDNLGTGINEFVEIAPLDGDTGNARGIANALINTIGTDATKGYIGTLDTLKVANLSSEASDKTITGGQYNSPLIKFYNGKTARLEMQDALGHASMLQAFSGAINEFDTDGVTDISAVHFGGDIPSSKTILGESFFIDRNTGAQVPVQILFYNLMPEPIFNLTQDAEGDATVFDMNGDLLLTDIKIASQTASKAVTHGVFYSIIDPVAATSGN